MRILLKSLVVFTLLTLCLAPVVGAQEDRLSPEEMAKIDATLVPSPSELFVAVNNMGDFDWDSVVTSNTNSNYDNMYLRALNLGVRSADGFLAIQARDNKKLGEIVSTILALARAMAVDEMILAKGSELHALATNKKWDEVHYELDKLRGQVEDYIRQLGDDQNAVLVAAGGWLEGLRAVTKLLSENYNEKASSILHQPDLVRYFLKEFDNMSPRYKRVPIVQIIERKLPEIEKLIQGEPGQPISKEAVDRLYTLATELILAIERG
jgi:hypothetical protein